MNNVIDSYNKFKIYYLKKLASILYNLADITTEEILLRYLNNYFNAKFYNIYETLSDDNQFSFTVLKQEYRGLEVELLETYPKYTKQVKELKRIAYFVCYLDDIYQNDEEVKKIAKEAIKKDTFIKTILGKKEDKFISELIKMSAKENKILEAEINKSFKLVGNEQNQLVIVNLEYDIKALSSYRKTLVNQVYKDQKIYLKKTINTFNKLSFKLLKDKCLGLNTKYKYVVLLDSPIISEGDFVPEIRGFINNKLFINKVSIALPVDILLGKEKIFKNEIKISGYRDMRYVNDVSKKLSTVLDLPIEYFIITNYKAKQEANITDYSDLDYRVVIYEEED